MCQCGKVEGNTHIEHQMCNNGLMHFPGLKSKYGVCNLIMEVKHYVLGSVGFTMHKELHVAQDIT